MIRMEVSGLDELEKQLIALGEKAGKKVLRDAGKAALAIVRIFLFDTTSAFAGTVATVFGVRGRGSPNGPLPLCMT